MNVIEILQMKDTCIKAMDEQRSKDWLNKINSRPRKKKRK